MRILYITDDYAETCVIPDDDALIANGKSWVHTNQLAFHLSKLEIANQELKRLGASEEFLEKTKIGRNEPGDYPDHTKNPLPSYASALKR